MGVGTRLGVGDGAGVEEGTTRVEVAEGGGADVRVAGGSVGVKEAGMVEKGRGVEVSVEAGGGERRGGTPEKVQAARVKGSRSRARSRRRQGMAIIPMGRFYHSPGKSS